MYTYSIIRSHIAHNKHSAEIISYNDMDIGECIIINAFTTFESKFPPPPSNLQALLVNVPFIDGASHHIRTRSYRVVGPILPIFYIVLTLLEASFELPAATP